jgi:hypothetical protein
MCKVCSQTVVLNANYFGLSSHFGDQVNVSRQAMVLGSFISVYFLSNAGMPLMILCV